MRADRYLTKSGGAQTEPSSERHVLRFPAEFLQSIAIIVEGVFGVSLFANCALLENHHGGVLRAANSASIEQLVRTEVFFYIKDGTPAKSTHITLSPALTGRDWGCENRKSGQVNL